MDRILGEYLFTYICRIVPNCDETGTIRQFYPQLQYENLKQYTLHKWGEGSFCHFCIPIAKKPALAGVYILIVDNQPVYVGECANLVTRFNSGYGHISPRNCYQRGRSTNCRINNLIYRSVVAGQKIDLWFKDTNNRKDVEASLIQILQTRQYWNLRD